MLLERIVVVVVAGGIVELKIDWLMIHIAPDMTITFHDLV